MSLVPARVTFDDVARFVAARHRHHPTMIAECATRFVLGAWDTVRNVLCGVAVVGNPSGRGIPADRIVKVNRLCTDGTKGACSFLYALAARTAAALGWAGIITYTLKREGGASLRTLVWWDEELPRGQRRSGWDNREGRTSGGVRGEVRWLKLLNDFRAPEPVVVESPQAALFAGDAR